MKRDSQLKNDVVVVDIYRCDPATKHKLPLYLSKIRAGFPSPADDYVDKKLDLNEYVVKHPAATFFVKVKGDSMINAGILPGSILVVDRSLEAQSNKIVVAVLDGEFTVKRLKKSRNKIVLLSENSNYDPIEITPDRDFAIWGVVTHVFHSL
ncbi:MAG: translesion error-prone DNA polymerase V autoproteolytic subunit [Candidatus Omnitrophica bacterium]|nr:translesion error-prone DNA polymerase V autoproteolytic subunit [Candidatus Omnitrophota bacterium]